MIDKGYRISNSILQWPEKRNHALTYHYQLRQLALSNPDTVQNSFSQPTEVFLKRLIITNISRNTISQPGQRSLRALL